MLRTTASWLVALALTLGVLSCGPSEEEQQLEQLQQDLQTANAAIDSLNYTVESSNLLIDELRAQVDSTQVVNDKLLASVQQLNREVRQWRQLATEYQQKSEQYESEIERMKLEKQADMQAIAQLRTETDSLSNALLDAHTSIRRQSDQIREMEVELAQTRDEVAALRTADTGVTLFSGSEDALKEMGYLDVDRSLGRAFRKVFKLTTTLDPNDAQVQVVGIGESFELVGELDVLVDRYGKLKEGRDYEKDQREGSVTVTFVNELVGGSDIVAVMKGID